MSKVLKEGEPCKRYHVWLYERDSEWIDANVDYVKRSKFIRMAVRRAVRACKEAQGGS